MHRDRDASPPPASPPVTPFPRSASERLALAFFFLLLLFAAYARFSGITEQGVGGGDCTKYFNEAVRWAAGDAGFMGNRFYRPAVYIPHGLSLRILGTNDHAIKALHGVLDLATISLIFLMGTLLGRSFWLGLACSLHYAFLPDVVRIARIELVHTLTTHFLALAFFAYVAHELHGVTGWRSRLALFLSGLFLGIAANTHIDILFLAPGFAFVVALKHHHGNGTSRWLSLAARDVALLFVGTITPYLLGMLTFGPSTVLTVIWNEISVSKESLPTHNPPAPRLMIPILILSETSRYAFGNSVIFLLFLAGALLIAAGRARDRLRDPSAVYLPWAAALTYISLYALFVGTFSIRQARLFLPVLPMLFLAGAWLYWKFFERLLPRRHELAFASLAFGLFLLAPKTLIPNVVEMQIDFAWTYKRIGDRVDSDNRLLIAPAAAWHEPRGRGWTMPHYFGTNAVYQFELPAEAASSAEGLNRLLLAENIRFVFIGDRHDPDVLAGRPGRGDRGAWVGDPAAPYSLDRDLAVLHELLQQRRAVTLFESRHGKLFRLPPDSETPNASAAAPVNAAETAPSAQ